MQKVFTVPALRKCHMNKARPLGLTKAKAGKIVNHVCEQSKDVSTQRVDAVN